jgi:flagellin FlaB
MMHRLVQKLRQLRQQQEGITGLETAIILIAFVIVASVFAYVVLSAGLFSAQKAKEAVNAGVGSTMSVIELKGDVVAKMESGVVTNVYLYVGLPAAGNPVDFSTNNVTGTKFVVVSYHDEDVIIPSVNWTIEKLCDMNSDDILDQNELFVLDVDLASTGNVTIGPYHKFTLEVKPPDGPVLPVERRIPPRISQYVNLY